MFEVKPSSTLLFPTSVSIYYYTKKTIPAQESYNLSSQNPFDSFQPHQRTFIKNPSPSSQQNPHRESPILSFMAGVHSPRSRAGLVLCGAGGFLRACLKIAFRQLCVPLCGRFSPDEGGVAGYVDRIGAKYTAKWGVQMAGMNLQTRPRAAVDWTHSGGGSSFLGPGR